VSFFLVVVPVTLVGFQVYNTFQTETFVNTEKDLKNIAKDWFNTTEAYILEQDRVLKREEFLYEKRLESVTLVAESMLELVSEGSSNPSQSKLQATLNKIAEIKIGSSGTVLMFDSKGDIWVSQNKALKGENILKITTKETSGIFSDAIKKIVNLKKDETLTITYAWNDDGSTSGGRQKVGVFTYLKPLDLIIGTSAYVTDFKSEDLNGKLVTELKDLMAQQKIGDNGYIWAINSKGDYIVSKNMYRNGENVIGERDQNGVFTIQGIIDSSKKLPRGESYVRYYPWRNIGEKNASEMVSASVYVPEWDWIIGVSAYNDDFLKGLATIRLQIFYTVLVTTALGMLAAYIFALLLSRPIKKLEQTAVKVAAGDFEKGVERNLTTMSGEIGSLARSFDTMIVHLRNKISTLSSMNVNLEESRKEAEKNLLEVSRMNKFMVGRELKMAELKKQLHDAQIKAGITPTTDIESKSDTPILTP